MLELAKDNGESIVTFKERLAVNQGIVFKTKISSDMNVDNTAKNYFHFGSDGNIIYSRGNWFPTGDLYLKSDGVYFVCDPKLTYVQIHCISTTNFKEYPFSKLFPSSFRPTEFSRRFDLSPDSFICLNEGIIWNYTQESVLSSFGATCAEFSKGFLTAISHADPITDRVVIAPKNPVAGRAYMFSRYKDNADFVSIGCSEVPKSKNFNKEYVKRIAQGQTISYDLDTFYFPSMVTESTAIPVFAKLGSSATFIVVYNNAQINAWIDGIKTVLHHETTGSSLIINAINGKKAEDFLSEYASYLDKFTKLTVMKYITKYNEMLRSVNNRLQGFVGDGSFDEKLIGLLKPSISFVGVITMEQFNEKLENDGYNLLLLKELSEQDDDTLRTTLSGIKNRVDTYPQAIKDQFDAIVPTSLPTYLNAKQRIGVGSVDLGCGVTLHASYPNLQLLRDVGTSGDKTVGEVLFENPRVDGIDVKTNNGVLRSPMIDLVNVTRLKSKATLRFKICARFFDLYHPFAGTGEQMNMSKTIIKAIINELMIANNWLDYDLIYTGADWGRATMNTHYRIMLSRYRNFSGRVVNLNNDEKRLIEPLIISGQGPDRIIDDIMCESPYYCYTLSVTLHSDDLLGMDFASNFGERLDNIKTSMNAEISQSTMSAILDAIHESGIGLGDVQVFGQLGSKLTIVPCEILLRLPGTGFSVALDTVLQALESLFDSLSDEQKYSAEGVEIQSIIDQIEDAKGIGEAEVEFVTNMRAYKATPKNIDGIVENAYCGGLVE